MKTATAALLLFALVTACRRAPDSGSGRSMIVIGVDGMDPRFVESHWSALPNLDRLRREGDFQRLATSIPPQSPVAWSGIITGMDPGGHGIFDFVHRDPKTRMPFSPIAEVEEPRLNLSFGPWSFPLSSGKARLLRGGKAFWEILSQHGIKSTVIRMPVNFPPVECEAQSLAGMGTPDLQGTFGTFSYYTQDAAEERETVPGGRIERVEVSDNVAKLLIRGPVNTLRKDRSVSSIPMTVYLDPAEPVARLDIGESQIVLREGEWSEWIRVRFPLIAGIRGAAGMFRVLLRKVRPLQLYVSPVNIDPLLPELPISTPASYSRTLAQNVGEFYTQGIAEDTSALRADALTHQEFLAQSRKVLDDSLRMFDYTLGHFEGGLFFYYFSSIDLNSHMLWGKYDDDLLGFYKTIDGAIGRAMEKTEKAGGNATLLVISDHGFASFDRAVHLNTWLLREGFLALDDPDNVGAGELFAHVNWAKTKAYAMGLNGLYLNLKGRESGGIVEPGIEADAVARSIAERLRAMRDPDTGASAIGNVYTAQLFHGRNLRYAPDLIVGYRRGYRGSWQTALGAVPAAMMENNTDAWIGDHCMAAESVPGVFFANRKASAGNLRIYDVPVTILREFGLPPAPGMIGRAIF